MSKIIGDLKSAGNVGGSVNFTRGEKGERGDSGVYVGSGEMPADCNVQVDPDGDATVVLVGKTWTLDEASEAAVWNTGGAGNVVLNFGIPRGVKGDKGDRGSTPYIGDNLHWWVDGKDTGVSAHGFKGDDGVTPHIGSDGNWYIGDQNTGVRATPNDGFTPFIGDDGNWITSGGDNTGIPATGPQGPQGEPGKDAVGEWEEIYNTTLTEAVASYTKTIPADKKYTEVFVQGELYIDTDATASASIDIIIGRPGVVITRNTVTVKNGTKLYYRVHGWLSPAKTIIYDAVVSNATAAGNMVRNAGDSSSTTFDYFPGVLIQTSNSTTYPLGAGSIIKIWGR